MAVEFAAPHWLWLLPPLLAFTAWALLGAPRPRRRPRGPGTAGRAAPDLAALRLPGGGVAPRRPFPWRPLLVRATLLVLLAGALAQPAWRYGVRRRAVVFVVDRSASVATAQPAAQEFIRRAAAARGADDRVAVVAAGRAPRVEVAPSDQPLPADAPAGPGDDFTDLAAALRLAGSLLPQGYGRQVVLVSDGRENLGDARAAALALAAAGVRVDAVPLGAPAAPDVLAGALAVPERLFAGEEVPLDLVLHSTVAQPATVRIYAGRRLVAERPLALRAGRNEIAFRLPAPEPGFHTFQAVVEADRNSVAQNDAVAAIARVEGSPPVLVVEGEPADGAALAAALAASGWQAERVAPQRMPGDPAALRRYGAVFLMGVAARDLGDGPMAALEAYVRDLGGGLAMVGGEAAFGLGGYHQTPVERALPVQMQPRGKGDIPTVGLVLAVDRSASMGTGNPAKLELAKQAATGTAGLLGPADQVGVVGFDAAAGWVAPLAPVTDPEGLAARIGGVHAGGGTNVYAGLALAYAGLADAPVRLKHIILLTDGVSSYGGDYAALVDKVRAAGITLSTVALGADADQLLLQDLARAGGGRYYYAERAQAVPRIFTQETLAAVRSYAVEQRFTPAAAAPSPLLAGLGALPPVAGYVATSPKPAAEVALQAPDGDPVLAAWRYGLGRAVAWTPDLKGRWAAAWLGTPELTALAANLAGWLAPPTDRGPLQAAAAYREGTAHVTALLPPDLAAGGLAVRITGPDGDVRTADLRPEAPGRYRAEVPGLPPGPHLAQVTAAAGATATAPIVVPYPVEYRTAGLDRERLQAIAAAGGGALLTAPAAVWRARPPLAGERSPLAPWLLGLAAAALVADVALRRGLADRRRPRPAALSAAPGADGASPGAPGPAAPPPAASPGAPGPADPPAAGGPDQPHGPADAIGAILAARRRRRG